MVFSKAPHKRGTSVNEDTLKITLEDQDPANNAGNLDLQLEEEDGESNNYNYATNQTLIIHDDSVEIAPSNANLIYSQIF